MKVIKESIQLGDAELSIETGKLAKQAHGSVVVSCGETMVLASCVGTEDAKEDRGFFPLTVDYRENFYAAGRFPGGFFKREGRLSTRETLVCRMIDRPMRPMFTEGYIGETQIQCMVISADGENESDILGMIGGAAAAYLSPVPFPQAMASVRVGLIDDALVVNPTVSQREKSSLDLVVSGTRDAIAMVEAGAEFISEETMVEALEFAHRHIGMVIDGIERIREQMDVCKWPVEPSKIDPDLYGRAQVRLKDEMIAALTIQDKAAANRAVKELKEKFLEEYQEDEELLPMMGRAFSMIKETVFRAYVLEQRKRTDGRAFDEVRPIWCEVGYLPSVHGSAVFTRGETQALVSLTMGTSTDSQVVDSMLGESKARFMLHYNFPPFSVGETRPIRGPGRREIGHGALAERALAPVLPKGDDFPYTLRLVSEILESNGSSSMASVCGGCLAMMDAGVKIASPVAGVAMGLVMEDGKYAILTDIQGAEDHYGDMDFKVTGTEQGITALQMDIKVQGLTREIMAEALAQARAGRLHILEKMKETIEAPREEYRENVPQIHTMYLPVDKIRDVIGSGGKVIKSIIDKTGVKIDIEDDGRCVIFSPKGSALKTAIETIEELIAVPEPGKAYKGKVKRIVDFGAFVEILPNTEGLLHISEIANYRVRAVTDELKEGEEVMVKVLSVEHNGRIRLSRKALLV